MPCLFSCREGSNGWVSRSIRSEGENGLSGVDASLTLANLLDREAGVEGVVETLADGLEPVARGGSFRVDLEDQGGVGIPEDRDALVGGVVEVDLEGVGHRP